LREPNLGKTNPCVTLHYLLAICFAPSLADSFIFLTLTRLVVVFIFVNFSFALFTPPLGDYQIEFGYMHLRMCTWSTDWMEVLYYLYELFTLSAKKINRAAIYGLRLTREVCY
jgi:hypothetical protein